MSGIIDLCSDDDEVQPDVNKKIEAEYQEPVVPPKSEDVDFVEAENDESSVQQPCDSNPQSASKHEHQLGPGDNLHTDPEVLELKSEISALGQLICEYEATLADARERYKILEDNLTTRTRVLRERADASFDWLTPFPWDPLLWDTLESVFFIKEFRNFQRQALNATLLKRDVFTILPTGGGKSLIYQLAAIVDAGLTLVITPLISLSQDQQAHLRRLGIRAEALDSTTPKNVQKNLYDEILPPSGVILNSKDPRKPNNLLAQAREAKRIQKEMRRRQHGKKRKKRGYSDAHNTENEIHESSVTKLDASAQDTWIRDDMDPVILFVTPEQIVKSKRLMSRLESLHETGHFSRICIDEAHCCSNWGHDFRPDYKKLGILRRQCPDVPILALTATCSPDTAAHVTRVLEMRECVTFRGSIDRPNLFYDVHRVHDSEGEVFERVVETLNSQFRDQCGIIYVLSKKDAEIFSDKLVSAGILAGCYHGDLEQDERSSVYEQWSAGELHVVVATIAFGMGIDNQNTRFVIHATISTSLEGYYQESGRCGRDGNPGHCLAFLRSKDFTRLSSFVADKGQTRVEKFYEMYKYATGRLPHNTSSTNSHNVCRRATLAHSFNEMPPERKNETIRDCCDLCRTRIDHSSGAGHAPHKLVRVDVSKLASSVVRILMNINQRNPNERVTMLAVAQYWGMRGAKAERVRRNEPMINRLVTIDSRLEILIELIFLNGLKEHFRHSSYTINAYVTLGPKAQVYANDSTSSVILTASTLIAWELCTFADCQLVDASDSSCLEPHMQLHKSNKVKPSPRTTRTDSVDDFKEMYTKEVKRTRQKRKAGTIDASVVELNGNGLPVETQDIHTDNTTPNVDQSEINSSGEVNGERRETGDANIKELRRRIVTRATAASIAELEPSQKKLKTENGEQSEAINIMQDVTDDELEENPNPDREDGTANNEMTDTVKSELPMNDNEPQLSDSNGHGESDAIANLTSSTEPLNDQSQANGIVEKLPEIRNGDEAEKSLTCGGDSNLSTGLEEMSELGKTADEEGADVVDGETLNF